MRTPTSRVGITLALAACVAAAAVLLADPISPMTIADVDSPDPVASGAQLTYTITMVNTAGSKVTNAVMTDLLNGVGGIGVPPQLQITSSRGSCTQSTNLVTCNGGAIEGGGSWVVTIRGVVTASNGTTINNTASITGTRSAQNFTSTTTATTLVNNNSGSPLPDLTISKTGPTSVKVSSPMTYTLTINNQGSANATNIKVVDTVPCQSGLCADTRGFCATPSVIPGSLGLSASRLAWAPIFATGLSVRTCCPAWMKVGSSLTISCRPEPHSMKPTGSCPPWSKFCGLHLKLKALLDGPVSSSVLRP